MKANQTGAAPSLLAAGTLLLSACGSDNNAAPGSGCQTDRSSASDSGACAGKKSLRASGATAQANAMVRFIAAYQQACPGFPLDYTSNGSGAGVLEFTGAQTDLGGSDSPLDPEKGEVEAAATSAAAAAEAWDLPVVLEPDRRHLQRRRASTGLVLDGPTLGQDLQRCHQDLGRAGDRRAERGRDAPRGTDQRALPQRRVRHHRQLPEVPRRCL